MRQISDILATFLFIAIWAGDASFGQRLTMDWYTIDGGGQMWTAGGPLELSGTIGQPDTDGALSLSGGTLSLTGGFWPGAAPPTPSLCPGDSNCDGSINWRDIDFFVAAQNDNVSAWTALHMQVYGAAPSCSFESNDVDNSGTVSWRDIDPFVALQNTTCP